MLRPKNKCERNTENGLKEIRWEKVERVGVVQDKDQFLAVVNRVLDLPALKNAGNVSS
jgi:hypothetical protein